MTEHRLRSSVDVTGWRASCSCGWSTCRPTRDQRQHDIDEHLAFTVGHVA
jgi:hypothetical protein